MHLSEKYRIEQQRMSMRQKFSNEETRFIIIKYAQLQSPTLVKRKFFIEFNIRGRETLKYKIGDFSRVWKRFLQLPPSSAPTGRPKQMPNEDVTDSVRGYFQRNPKNSCREGARDLNLSLYTVWSTLRKIVKFKPYKNRKVKKFLSGTLNSETLLHFGTKPVDRIFMATYSGRMKNGGFLIQKAILRTPGHGHLSTPTRLKKPSIRGRRKQCVGLVYLEVISTAPTGL